VELLFDDSHTTGSRLFADERLFLFRCSLHKSLSQEANLRDQFHNTLETYQSHIKNRDSVMDQAYKENKQLAAPAESGLLAGKPSGLKARFTQVSETEGSQQLGKNGRFVRVSLGGTGVPDFHFPGSQLDLSLWAFQNSQGVPLIFWEKPRPTATKGLGYLLDWGPGWWKLGLRFWKATAVYPLRPFSVAPWFLLGGVNYLHSLGS